MAAINEAEVSPHFNFFGSQTPPGAAPSPARSPGHSPGCARGSVLPQRKSPGSAQILFITAKARSVWVGFSVISPLGSLHI